MIRTLLLRGMLADLLAVLLAFAFARWAGEPQVERAMAFESNMARASDEPREPEVVSRKIQRSIGC
jgi:Probable cobalt transporter subunit (CbtA)